MKKKMLLNIFYSVSGSLAYGVGICCFLNSSNIAPGGVSGISIMANYLFGLPIGITSVLINIPILAIGYFKLSKRLITHTAAVLLFSSFITDYIVSPFFPIYSGDRLLGSVFGGVLIGVGLGLIFSGGNTTGGTDILSLLLKLKFPQLRIGIAMLIIDGIILSSSIIVFKNIESALYGIIALFCSSMLIDRIVYASDRTSLTFIISAKHSEIAKKILTELGRGVTIIDGVGGYTKSSVKIIMCAVRRQEFPQLKELTFSEDACAFLSTVSTEGIFGEGFYKNSPF